VIEAVVVAIVIWAAFVTAAIAIPILRALRVEKGRQPQRSSLAPALQMPSPAHLAFLCGPGIADDFDGEDRGDAGANCAIMPAIERCALWNAG
jgi:hypothetical protein